MTWMPPLPAWATKLPDVRMVRGADLKEGDTVYFTEKAYPRILWKKLDARNWSAIIVKSGDYHVKGEASLDPRRCYVVKRENPKPLAYVRVDGEDLEGGDVVEFGMSGNRSEIIQIGDVEHIMGKGRSRRAVIQNTTTGERREYVFCNFSLLSFTVVGGPKLQAAQANSKLVRRMPVGYRWIGG